MNNIEFSLDILIAVSDWQRGGDAKQKQRRGKALRDACRNLPEEFKSASVCYRQLALDGAAVWKAGTELALAESVSAWTESLEVAKTFKGGVPSVEYQGAIFSICPSEDQIVANLAKLYSDEKFCNAMQQNASQITGYQNGAGKYWDLQKEVVIELEVLPVNSIYAWGGYSSPELELARKFYDHPPSDAELSYFRKLMEKAGHTAGGPYWLTTSEAVQRVNEKLEFHGNRLRGRA